MARPQPYGYLASSTNKYGGAKFFPYLSPKYGGRRSGEVEYHEGLEDFARWDMYGLNYPPPEPESFSVQETSPFTNSAPTYVWSALPLETEHIAFQIQVNYHVDDFSDPNFDFGVFNANQVDGTRWWTYTTPGFSRLDKDGKYYARIRATDGFTYTDWSDSISFEYWGSKPCSPTIDPVTSPADNLTQLITGTKSPGVYVFLTNNDGDRVEVSYPGGVASGIWEYTLLLSAGKNEIKAYASRTQEELVFSAPATAVIYTIFFGTEGYHEGDTHEIEKYNVWNCFDEIGMLVSLDRIHGEKNKSYKARILDVYQNPGNSTYQGLINAIARELAISQEEVKIFRLSDLADQQHEDNILNEDGTAIGTKLEEYVREVYDNNPFFWGNIVADEGVWDAIDEEYSGMSYLPHLWDSSASGVYKKWQKPGIGDTDDLNVKSVVKILDETKGIIGPVTGEGMMRASGVLVDDLEWRLRIHSGYFYATAPSGVHNWS